MSRILKALPLLSVVAVGPAPAAELPRGVLVEKVTAAADPSQSYALYLPTAYDPKRRWPVLYALDARGRALVPAERFRPAAEKHGYVLASSYNSASDGPVGATVEATRALWTDTHARLSLDERRVYLAGFSGTARTACFLASAAPGSVAGVIGAGAGFPADDPPTRQMPFVFFGAVGDRDFNYYELVDLDQTLDALGVRHRIELFPGVHEWPPEEVAAAALLWMEVQAIRDGRRERSDELLAELWGREREQAQAAEAAGRLVEAHRRLVSLARDLDGLRDVLAATREAARIAASRVYAEESKERKARQKRDQAALARAREALAAADPSDPGSLGRLVSDLRLAELKARGEKGPGTEDALSAARVLNTLLVQTGFYLPRTCSERGDHARAALFLALATEIRPGDPEVWFELAVARARGGHRRDAVEALQRAVREGFADAERLESNAAFESLRSDGRFQALLERLRAERQEPSG